MSLKSLLPIALVLGLLGACDTSAPAPPILSDVPVVLVILDALSAEHVSHLGYDRLTTPNLDALAAEGFSFKAAFSPAPYTVAGVASLITGRLPDSHGVTKKTRRLRETETTLAELLSRSGQPSLAVVSNPNGGERLGVLEGFDRVVATYEVSEQRPANYTMPGRGTKVHLPQAEESADEFQIFLEGLKDPSSGFFFYAHILQPHSPYQAPAELRNRWLDPNYDGRFKDGDNRALIANRNKIDELGQADIDAVRDLYDSNLLWADHGLGLILDELKRKGIYEKALIIVTSDHGEAMFQHGRWGHNSTLFDEMVRIPLVVRLPGSSKDEAHQGKQLESPVSTIDILPSLAQWLDLGLPANIDGHSFAPAIAGLGNERDQGIFLRDHSTPATIGLRSQTEKIILHQETASTRARLEFYDLVVDPGEKSNLIPSKDPRTLNARIALKQRSAEISAKRRLVQTEEAAETPLTTEESEMLGALGYMEDDPPNSSEGQD